MRRVVYQFEDMTADQLNGSVPIIGGSGCITWHSTYETSGSASASYILVDTAGQVGPLLMYVTLSAGQSTRDYIGLHALPFTGGLFINVASGDIDGSITAWTDHICEDVLTWRAAVQAVEGAAALKILGE